MEERNGKTCVKNVSKESQESVGMKSQLNTLIADSGAEYCVCKKDYRKKLGKLENK